MAPVNGTKEAVLRKHEVHLPQCVWPQTVTSKILPVLFVLLTLVCFYDPDLYPYPLKLLISPLRSGSLLIVRNQHSLLILFYCTVLVHISEGIYALYIIRRALRGHFGGARALMWALQVTLVGFPSLILLMRLLSDLERIHGEKRRWM